MLLFKFHMSCLRAAARALAPHQGEGRVVRCRHMVPTAWPLLGPELIIGGPLACSE